jgi:hypothetical protein
MWVPTLGRDMFASLFSLKKEAVFSTETWMATILESWPTSLHGDNLEDCNMNIPVGILQLRTMYQRTVVSRRAMLQRRFGFVFLTPRFEVTTPALNTDSSWLNTLMRSWRHLCKSNYLAPNIIYMSGAGVAAGYGLDGRGYIPDKGKWFLSTPQPPYRLWGPLNLLSNGYRGSFPEGKEVGEWSWSLTSI